VIALILAMVWSRRGQAVTLALLSLFGVAAAVAAPAYLRAADRAVAAGQVEAAAPAERTVALVTRQQDRRDDQEGAASGEVDLDRTGASLVDLPGFEYVYSAEYPAVGIEPDERDRTRFVYRQDVCDHVRITAGRCLIGEADVLLGAATAKRLGIRPGDSVTFSYAALVTGPGESFYAPDGTAKPFLVAGTYEVPDPGEVYWGEHAYFGAAPGGEPAFVTHASLTAMDHGKTEFGIDGYAAAGALGVDQLPGVRAGLTSLAAAVADLGPAVELRTGLPGLLSRIDSGRAAAHRIVPVLAVCLVLLACLTIFLAVGYGTEGRRPELAVVALRGARWGQRWWLATGETLVAIVAGAVGGCVAGQLLVNAFAAWRFPGVGADPGLDSLRWAPVAAGAAVLTALLASQRQLTTPVVALLRRAPAVPGSAAAIAFEVVVVALAVVAAVQLSDGLSGVGTFAAGLLLIAGALVAARLLLPWATVFARRQLRRGRAEAALAGFQLSRRPGAVRLFALLTAAVAVAGYAAAAVDVGARGRASVAILGTGAPRVLSVAPVGRQGLLAAVRAADPSGRFAMAAVRRTGLPSGAAPLLAVDTTRLSAVAAWPGNGPGDAAVAAGLHPAAAAPVEFANGKITFDITATDFGPGKAVTVTAVLSPVAGLTDELLPLGVLRDGRHPYGRDVPRCARGCRLNALRIEGGHGAVDVSGKITLHNLTGGTPWRAAQGGRAEAGPGGVRIEVTSLNGLVGGMVAEPADGPYPLPVATAGVPAMRSLSGLDAREIPVTVAARLPVVPGAGSPAVLADIDYADRLSADGVPSSVAEVWLGEQAPPDVVQRLTAQGLVVTSDTRAADVRRRLDTQGPALALWFYVIVAALAAALAAGTLELAAAVDRARRIEDLSALRVQGLRRTALRRAAVWTYPVLVAAAVPAGLAIALLGWRVTGGALPLAGLDPPPFPLPRWPRPVVLAGTGVGLFALLAGVAIRSGRRTLRAVTPR